MPYRVTMNPADDDRDAVRDALLALGTLPDGEVLDDDDGLGLRLDHAQSSDAAVARASVLIAGALDGSAIDAASVRLSVEADWRP